MALKVGTRVVLYGLTRKEMNGKTGTITSVLTSNDRQAVRLDDGWKVVALRPFNFRPAPTEDLYESDGSMPSLESVVDSDEDADQEDGAVVDDVGQDDAGSGQPTADSYESDGSMPSLESMADSDEDAEDAEDVMDNDDAGEEELVEHNRAQSDAKDAPTVQPPLAASIPSTESYDSDGSMPSLESVVDSDEEGADGAEEDVNVVVETGAETGSPAVPPPTADVSVAASAHDSDGSMPSLESVADSDEDADPEDVAVDDDGAHDVAGSGQPTADSYDSDGSMPSLESIADSDEDAADAEEDDEGEKGGGTDDAGRIPGMIDDDTWPAPLKLYVERAFGQCSSVAERRCIGVQLRDIITEASRSGALDSTDWAGAPLPIDLQTWATAVATAQAVQFEVEPTQARTAKQWVQALCQPSKTDAPKFRKAVRQLLGSDSRFTATEFTARIAAYVRSN